jgi:SAM-dependent methyltransferase
MTNAMTKMLGRAGSLARRVRGQDQTPVPLEELEPPEVLSEAVSGGDFRSVGREFADHLIRLGGLRPDDRVLDIGCGTGRIAVPLLDYLGAGSYEGFDVHPEGIRWCEANLTSRNTAFRFRSVPVQSGWFNPWGKEPASDFTFPYADGEFDLAFAVSLFTHLLPPATERYLSELARVLRPGGRWLATFFLIAADGQPPPSPEWLAPPGWPPPVRFQRQLDHCRILDPDNPERAVAHQEDWLRAAIERAGLSVRATHRGYWPGRHGLSYQDILLGDRDPNHGA